MISLGTFLRQQRMNKNLSLRHVANCIGCSPAFLSDVELGRRMPGEDALVLLGFTLGIPRGTMLAHDTRPPIDLVRRRCERDPSFSFALRKILHSRVSADALLALTQGKTRAGRVLDGRMWEEWPE